MGAESYGDLLKAAMKASNANVLGLAREIAARRQTDVEGERGKLKAYRRNETLPDPEFSELLVELLEEPRLLRTEKNRRRAADFDREAEELWAAIGELRVAFARLEGEWVEGRSRQVGAPPRRAVSESGRVKPQ